MSSNEERLAFVRAVGQVVMTWIAFLILAGEQQDVLTAMGKVRHQEGTNSCMVTRARNDLTGVLFLLAL